MTCRDAVVRTMQQYQMAVPGDRLLVAFSGGADSTALTLMLKALDFKLVLGHVDHGMRRASHLDAEHCSRVADDLELDFIATRVNVDPATQAQARKERYAALERMAEKAGASKIATGHTLDDQAETVRMRLERGGYGLGIPPVRQNIIRPLLGLRRSQSEQICRQAGVAFCTDPSNSNARYRRVALRAELAAASESEVLRLAGLAESALRETRDIARRVDELWSRLVVEENGVARVPRGVLRELPGPVRRQLIRRLAGLFDVELTNRVVDDVGKVLAVTGARLTLPSGLYVWSEREQVVLGRLVAAPALRELELSVPGTTSLPGWGLKFDVHALPATPAEDLRSAALTGDRSTEVVDAAAVGSRLVVRRWLPGDRFHPLGGPGTRKLQDYFVDAGIPRADRSHTPIVVSGDRIVWVAGCRLDDRFKIGPETTLALRISMSGVPTERVA